MPPQRKYDLKKIFFIGILILGIGGFLGYQWLKTSTPSQEPSSDARNLFPFSTNNTEPLFNEPIPDVANTPPDPNQGILTMNEGDRLRIIANYPVTDYRSFITQNPVTTIKIDPITGRETPVTTIIPTTNVLFNAEQNGNMIQAEVTKDAVVIAQKTKTLLPLAQELWFLKNNTRVVLRSWNEPNQTIETFLGNMPTAGTLDYCTTVFTEQLTKGSRGEQVKQLQRYIGNKLAIAITADGSFGAKTATLLAQLQKNLATEPTGIFDEPTRNLVNEDCISIQRSFQEKSRQPGEFGGGYLSEDILRGSVAPDQNEFFFLKKNSNGSVSGIISSSDGKNQRKLFDSPFTEWKPFWSHKDTLSITTLPSHNVEGYMYFVNTKTGVWKKILGPLNGLTTLTNPDGSLVAYTTTVDTTFISRIYNTKDGTTFDLPFATLVEKCTWENPTRILCAVPQTIPSASYPDAWYQGTSMFSDSLWSFDTLTKETKLIVNPSENFDMIHVGLSPNKDYIFFMHRENRSLWSYRLN